MRFFWVHFCFVTYFSSVSCNNPPHPVCIQTIKSLFWSYLLWWFLGLLHCWKMRWNIAGCVDLSLCLTLPLSCMGNIAEQGADVAVPSSPTCLFFSITHWRNWNKILCTQVIKNPKMQAWDLVTFAKPTHICIIIVLHVKTFMSLD